MKKKAKSGSLLHGIVAGMIVPAIFFMIIVLVRKTGESFPEYLSLIYQTGIIPKLISLCLIPNLLLFFYFIRSNRLKNARGVIFAMFIYGAVILIAKFV